MKKIVILFCLLSFTINLFGWKDGLKVAGDFDSWVLVDMIKDVDGDWEYFYPFKAVSTDNPSEFKFQRLGDNDTWYWMGDNNDDHYAGFGEDNINLGGVTEGETYIFTYVGSNDAYDMAYITSFKIVGNPVGGWTSGDAISMTEVDDPTNGDYWTYTFNVSSTGNKYFRLWPNGIQTDWNATWVFGSTSTSTDLDVGIETETVCGIGSETKALYFNANETGNWTISVRPHDKIVYANKGDHSTLPVELSTFTAQYINNTPTVYWTTQSETDNMGWFVYRNREEDFTSATQVSGMIEGHGTTTQQQSYIYEDVISNPQVGDVYYYWLESVDYSGTIHHFNRVAIITIPDINDPQNNNPTPVMYDLFASPNPFADATKIKFRLNQSAMVDVSIYDVKGALVKTFDTQHVTADDELTLNWNGKDNTGKDLPNGIYLYSLKVNGQDYATKQMILMK